MFFASGSSTGLTVGVCSSAVSSSDWAGYVVSSDFQNPRPLVVSVNGSWTVPQVSVSPSDSFSAVWVGIGGYFDDTLIQAGSEQDYVNGAYFYSVWYELLHADSITIDSINISPGDRIAVAINLVNSAANIWSIEVQDLTNRGNFKENFKYNSSRLSAEWIVERPEVDNTTSTLANFRNVTFSGSETVVGTQSGNIGAFPFVQVSMASRTTLLATVSPLSSDGAAFTINYAGAASLANYYPLIIAFALIFIILIVFIWTQSTHAKLKFHSNIE